MKDVTGWKAPGRLSSAIPEKFSTALGIGGGTVQRVFRGQLVVAIKGQKGSQRESAQEGRPPSNYQLKKDPNIVLYCNAEDVTPLVGPREVDLLEGVHSISSRHTLFVNGSRLEWALHLTKDTQVYINIPSPNLSIGPSCGIGVIRYIGQVGNQPGWLFGVEITVSFVLSS